MGNVLVRFSADGLNDGPENMRRDVELLHQAEAGVASCRVYEWSGPWVSLGRFQNPLDAVAPGFKRVVQRPTGGKAVLHGHDITVALAFRFEGRSVGLAYLRALHPVLDALAMCGVFAMTAGADSPAPDTSECFASASRYDIVDSAHGFKIAGAAMRVTKTALLLQVSIPYKPPLMSPNEAIQGARIGAVLRWNPSNFPDALAHFLNRTER